MNLGRCVLRLSAGLMVMALGCAKSGAQQADSDGNGTAGSHSGKEMQSQKMSTKTSASGYDITPLPAGEVKKLAAKLTPEQFNITQKAGTEPAFCGTLLDNKKDGVYACIVCGLPLFSSEHKFNSGTGWPSFYREFDPEHVSRKVDKTYSMVRTEINCARCNAHLGHVFDDGPKPSGERHCLNSASLTFHEKGEQMPADSQPMLTETAYFAGGCFWGIEHYFQKGPGVIDAVSGYMQGNVDNPTYKQVCYEDTGHAETVKVVYDPRTITFERLLEAFFAMHDPTQLNRQGPDVGSQYRSGIYTTNDRQEEAARAYIEQLQSQDRFKGKKIVTQVEPAKKFYPAEDYHQDYIVKTGRACHVTNPW